LKIYGGPSSSCKKDEKRFKVGDLVSISQECSTLAREELELTRKIGCPVSLKRSEAHGPPAPLNLFGLVVEIKHQHNISEPFYRIALSADADHVADLGTWFFADDMGLIS